MNRFFVFVKKETLQILRDSRTMLIIIMMPVMQIVLFGFAISMEVNNVDVAIYSPNHTQTTEQIATDLQHNSYITFKGYLDSTDEIDRLMKKGEIDVAVVVSDDIDRILAGNEHEKTGIGIATDASNTVISNMAANYVKSIISNRLNLSQSLPVDIQTKMLYNPQLFSSYTFVPGILGLIILIICAMITSISIVREKETGTIELLLVSPVRPLIVIGAKMIPYFLLSCLNLVTILVLAKYLLNVPMEGSLTAICGISLLYILLSLALGVCVSTLATNQVTAIIVCAVVMIIPVIMLSGLIFPIENIPVALQYLSTIVPARWYIDAMRKLMIEGLPFGAVLQQTGILIAMTVILIIVALKKFNDKIG